MDKRNVLLNSALMETLARYCVPELETFERHNAACLSYWQGTEQLGFYVYVINMFSKCIIIMKEYLVS